MDPSSSTRFEHILIELQILARKNQSGIFPEASSKLSDLVKIYGRNVDALHFETKDFLASLTKDRLATDDKPSRLPLVSKDTKCAAKKLKPPRQPRSIPSKTDSNGNVLENVQIQIGQRLDIAKSRTVFLSKRHNRHMNEVPPTGIPLFDDNERFADKYSFFINRQPYHTVKDNEVICINLESESPETNDFKPIRLQVPETLNCHDGEISLLRAINYDTILDENANQITDDALEQVTESRNATVTLYESSTDDEFEFHDNPEFSVRHNTSDHELTLTLMELTSNDPSMVEDAEFPMRPISCSSPIISEDSVTEETSRQNPRISERSQRKAKRFAQKRLHKKAKMLKKSKKRKVTFDPTEELRLFETRMQKSHSEEKSTSNNKSVETRLESSQPVKKPNFVTKRNFCVHDYGKEVLSWFKHPGLEEAPCHSFSQIVSQNPKCCYKKKDVSRLFLSTLHLANEGRIGIEQSPFEYDFNLRILEI